MFWRRVMLAAGVAAALALCMGTCGCQNLGPRVTVIGDNNRVTLHARDTAGQVPKTVTTDARVVPLP
jgi:hypothetical protein